MADAILKRLGPYIYSSRHVTEMGTPTVLPLAGSITGTNLSRYSGGRWQAALALVLDDYRAEGSPCDLSSRKVQPVPTGPASYAAQLVQILFPFLETESAAYSPASVLLLQPEPEGERETPAGLIVAELAKGAARASAKAVSSHETRDLLADFRRLTTAWKEEKLFISSMTAIEESPHYQGIIALGQAVVPLLLKELERDPDYWFTALQALTGEDPVPAEDRGDLHRMTEHWLTWGRRSGRRW